MVAGISTMRRRPAPGGVRAGHVGDDPGARALLQHAQGLIQKWPEGFQGFQATVRCRRGDRQERGQVSLIVGRCGQAEIDDADLRGPVEAMLADLSARHTPCFFKDGDGRHPVSFDGVGSAAAGWRVQVHIGPAEWRAYQIDPGTRLRQIEWLAGLRRTLTTIDEYVRATPGRLLPTRSTLTLSEPAPGLGRLVRVQDRYRRLGDVWLVAERRIEPLGPGEAVEIEILDPAPV